MQPLPGFRDFLPADCAVRNYIFARWREVSRRYGFVEWDGPILEPTDLYRKKSGPEIVGQLFNFTDKGEREVAMRPELTPTLARVVAAHEREFKKPLKWFSIPQCFRYEKQQRGRLREHFQLNCDIIGEQARHPDVELIALSIDLLRAFGLTKDDFVVRIGDRGFWTAFLEAENVPAEKWQDVLQIIDKAGRESPETTAHRLGPLARPFIERLERGADEGMFRWLMNALADRGLDGFAQIDVGIVRGLSYYTDTVFEVFDRAGKFRAIAGGGRYDNLIAQLSGGTTKIPAVGFAMGDVVLSELIRDRPGARAKMEQAIAEMQQLDVYVVIAQEGRRTDALAQVQVLRDAGFRVDYPLAVIKVGKQFQAAEQLGAQVALLFGDEWPQVKVKMLASREEQLVPHEELLAHLARLHSLSSQL